LQVWKSGETQNDFVTSSSTRGKIRGGGGAEKRENAKEYVGIILCEKENASSQTVEVPVRYFDVKSLTKKR
jgi:hypothetical protein